MRRLVLLLLLVPSAAGCGSSVPDVKVPDAIAAARARLVAGGVPRTLAFPAAPGSAPCSVAARKDGAAVSGTCSTAADRADVGAVVVTFTFEWNGAQHDWVFTVVPGGKAGPRGPAESGPAPWTRR